MWFVKVLLLLSHFSRVRLFMSLWTVTLQAPLLMGFSRQDYWSGLPCPPPGHLPDPGIKPTSLASPALAGRFFISRNTREALNRPYSSWNDVAPAWVSQLWLPFPAHSLHSSLNIIFEKIYWSIVDWQCSVNFCCTSGIQLYMCLCALFHSFPLCFSAGCWVYPVLYSRILLFIHSESVIVCIC